MNKKLLGAALALTAATLFATGQVAKAEGKKEEGKVKCSGINSCKGTGACGGATHSCKGKNECKGKGWDYTTSEEECAKKGGTVVKAKS